MGYTVNVNNNNTQPTSSLYFAPGKVATAADGSQTVTFTLADSTGEGITHTYVIKPNEYLIDWNIGLAGADKLLSQSTINFVWQAHPQQHEKSATYERQQSNVCYYEDNNFDYISSKNDRTFEKPVQWVGIVQQFFNTTVIAKPGFSFTNGTLQWKRATDTTKLLGDVTVNLQEKVQPGHQASVQLQLYYGPTDFSILSKQPVEDMAKMVNLGRDLYSFVRPINRFIIMPVFGFFSSMVGNLGWAILLLTLFIRLVTSPLTYTSYLSGAKMKVLRPELDKIKAKTGDNQQAFAMEQMKLFREAGVNPLGGCIPALLQIPIFFALFSFFNTNIGLRGVHFLWAKDMSSYDSFFHFNSDLPLVGDHIGLFTLTAILTSFLISLYNISNTPAQGPNAAAMKYMPYIFPFVLFFVFNRLPAALTWYYTVSNIITLGLQFVIQNYIINHDKILAAIEVKRKAPKTQSKFQERYSQIVETQKKVQELKNKNPGKK
jgi:YidC/Oxa1 family membrane protein insertase